MKHSTNISVLLSIVLAVIAHGAYSQNDNKVLPAKTYVVSGVVTEAETGDPLPGVNVVLQGSNRGIATDANGKFTFPGQLKEGQTLIFSFINLETQFYKVAAEGNENISIAMKIDPKVVLMEAPADNEVYAGRRSVVAAIKGWFK